MILVLAGTIVHLVGCLYDMFMDEESASAAEATAIKESSSAAAEATAAAEVTTAEVTTKATDAYQKFFMDQFLIQMKLPSKELASMIWR